MPRASIAWAAVALLGLILPAAAASRDADRRLDPRQVSPLPSQIRRVEPAVVGIRVEVPRDRPSAATLGVERWGSGVIFDADQGYVLTVSYVLLDAARIEVSLRDGRKVAARLHGLDLEVGVGRGCSSLLPAVDEDAYVADTLLGIEPSHLILK